MSAESSNEKERPAVSEPNALDEATLTATPSTDVVNLNRLHREVVAAAQSAVQKAIELGGELSRVRESLPHGQWLPFTKSLEFTDQTARNYIQLWERRAEIPNTVLNLTEAYRVLRPAKPVKVEPVRLEGSESGPKPGPEGPKPDPTADLKPIGVERCTELLGVDPVDVYKAIRLKHEAPQLFTKIAAGELEIEQAVEMVQTLDEKQARVRLKAIDNQIDQDLPDIICLGEHLTEVRDKRLYRERFETFAEYVEGTLRISPDLAYLAIDIAERGYLTGGLVCRWLNLIMLGAEAGQEAA